MRKTKWTNFYSGILATTTVLTVATVAKYMRKKYGRDKEKLFLKDIKENLLLADVKYIASYAFNRYVLDNDKVIDWIENRWHISLDDLLTEIQKEKVRA